MTDTPRLDARTFRDAYIESESTQSQEWIGDVVSVKFARELLAENERLRKALQGIVDLDDGNESALWKFHDAFHDAIEALK